jgi:hypothetical protein
MGAGSSIPEIPGGGSEGYHVLRVQPNSPGEKAGLEPFFDFIVMIGNTRLDRDDERLKEILKTNVEKPVKLLVFSSKTISVREVLLTPSTLWGGQGLLGVSIRFCTFETAHENVWHILDVENGSPAHLAGLRAFSDYIIGADSISLAEQDDLFSLVEAHDGRPLKLFVYNCDTDSCRDVVVTPNSAWGGHGLLGCGIGYGYLHRIPTSMHEHAVEASKIPTKVVAEEAAPPNLQQSQQEQVQPQNQNQPSNPVNNLPNIGNLSMSGLSPGLQNMASQNIYSGMNFQSSGLPTSSISGLPTSMSSGLPTSTFSSSLTSTNFGLPTSSTGNATMMNLPELNLNLPQIPGLPPLNLPSLDSYNKTLPSSTGAAGDQSTPSTTMQSSIAGLNLPNFNLPPLNLPSLNSTPGTSGSAGLNELYNIPGLPPLNLPSLSTTTAVPSTTNTESQ